MAMRGLTQFIADLRELRTYEAEKARITAEIANIRQHFREPNLNTYKRKKYVAKLAYIYTLGYPLDVDASDILPLVSMSKPHEKQIGYLAMGLMCSDNKSAIERAIPAVEEDLLSMSDLNTSMALNFVSSIADPPLQLATEIVKLLISPTSSTTVRKKAALTFLHLYRRDITILRHEWVERIIALLDFPDIGVATSVAALVKAIGQNNADASIQAANIAARRLQQLLIDRAFPSEYLYYDVPAPWFIVRLLEIIQIAPPSQDQAVSFAIHEAVSKILGWAITVAPGGVTSSSSQSANMRNAVFLEAINVFVHVDMDDLSLLAQTIDSLKRCLESKDTNLRYLALNSMVALTPFRGINQLLDPTLRLLSDKDISVRRRVLDSLYHLCNEDNIEHIAATLLDQLSSHELDLREETMVRLSDVIERFATSLKWYVDTTLSLLMVGGSHVPEEVWQRMVQIVVNNDQIQNYATRTSFDYVKGPRCSENTLRVGAYFLGEYGNQIAQEPGCSPLDQFLALQDMWSTSSAPVRYHLLTTYIKLANLFEDIRPQIMDVFELYRDSSDLELQQRSCEYYNLLRAENLYLLPTICDEMPPFVIKESPLAERLSQMSRPALARQNTLAKSTSVARNQSIRAQHSGRKLTPVLTGQGSFASSQAPASPALSQLTSLPPTAEETAPVQTPQITGKSELLSSNWEHGFRRMLTHPEAILYQDALLQVGCKYEFSRMGCIILYLKNISNVLLSSISVQLTNPMDSSVLTVSTKSLPSSNLKPGQVTEQVIICEAKQPFALSPTARITYLAGSLGEMLFRLPVTIERFMKPATMSPEDFARRWEHIGDSGEFKKDFRNFSHSWQRPIVDDDGDALGGLNWGLSFVENEKDVLLGAGMIQTVNGGNFGCLCRLEHDPHREHYRVTVRATKKLVAVILVKTISNVYQL